MHTHYIFSCVRMDIEAVHLPVVVPSETVGMGLQVSLSYADSESFSLRPELWSWRGNLHSGFHSNCFSLHTHKQ